MAGKSISVFNTKMEKQQQNTRLGSAKDNLLPQRERSLILFIHLETRTDNTRFLAIQYKKIMAN